MKKQINLKVFLIVLAALLVALTVATVILWPTLWKKADLDTVPATAVFGSDSDKYNGYADVTLYGAVADDGKDDTDAFIKAAETGAGVYVPLGTFDIKKTVTLRGQNLKGCGIDRTVIRFNGEGTIVELKGAALVDDITLCFGEEFITGNEAIGEQIAIKDSGITNGAMLRAVKLCNVGTGYYSDIDAPSDLTFTVESLLVEKFAHKAISIKNAQATLFRTTRIGEALANVDTAVSLGGSFTIEAFVFNKTKCNYPIEFLNSDSAVVNSMVFDGTEAASGSLMRIDSSFFSMRTVVAKETNAATLVKIEDTADATESSGNIVSLWTDGKDFKTDAENKIKCDSFVSQ